MRVECPLLHSSVSQETKKVERIDKYQQNYQKNSSIDEYLINSKVPSLEVSGNSLLKVYLTEKCKNQNHLNRKVDQKYHEAVDQRLNVPTSCIVTHSNVPKDANRSVVESFPEKKDHLIHITSSLPSGEMMTVNRSESYEPLTKRQKIDGSEYAINHSTYSNYTKTVVNEPNVISSTSNNEQIVNKAQLATTGNMENIVPGAPQTKSTNESEINTLNLPDRVNDNEDGKRDPGNECHRPSSLQNDQDILARACHAVGLDSAFINISELPEMSTSTVQHHKLRDPSYYTHALKNPQVYGYNGYRPPYINKEGKWYGPHPYGRHVNSAYYQHWQSSRFPMPRGHLPNSHHQRREFPHFFHQADVLPYKMNGRTQAYPNHPNQQHEKVSHPTVNRTPLNSSYCIPHGRIPYPTPDRPPNQAQGYSWQISRNPINQGTQNVLNSCRYATPQKQSNTVQSAGIFSPPSLPRESHASSINPQNYRNHSSPHVVPQSRSYPHARKQRLEYTPISSPISPPLSPVVDMSLYNKPNDKHDYHQTNANHSFTGTNSNHSIPIDRRALHSAYLQSVQKGISPAIPYYSNTNPYFSREVNHMHREPNIPSGPYSPQLVRNHTSNTLIRTHSEEHNSSWPAYLHKDYGEYTKQSRLRSNSLPSTEMILQNEVTTILCNTDEGKGPPLTFSPTSISSSPALNDLSLENQPIHRQKRRKVEASLSKVENAPLNSVCEVSEDSPSTWCPPNRNLTYTMIPQRASPSSPTQKSSCQYSSSASMFMSISETCGVVHPENYPTPPSVDSNNQPVASNSLLSEPSSSQISNLNKDCNFLSHQIDNHKNSNELNMVQTENSFNVDAAKVLSSNESNQTCDFVTPINIHYNENVKEKTNDCMMNVGKDLEPTLPNSLNDPYTSTNKQSDLVPSPFHPSEFEDETRTNQELDSSNNLPSVGGPLKSQSEPTLSEIEIQQVQRNETFINDSGYSQTKVQNFAIENAESIVKPNENERTNIETNSTSTLPIEQEQENNNCKQVTNKESSQEIKKTNNQTNCANHKLQQTLDFKEKLIPVLDHLLNVPEAEALKPLKNKPEQLLSHIVELWGGNSLSSQANDSSDRLREDFLTMVRLLFKPHLMEKWGWNDALPDQILDDLLKPSLDCGLFLGLGIKELSLSSNSSRLNSSHQAPPILKKKFLRKFEDWVVSQSDDVPQTENKEEMNQANCASNFSKITQILDERTGLFKCLIQKTQPKVTNKLSNYEISEESCQLGCSELPITHKSCQPITPEISVNQSIKSGSSNKKQAYINSKYSIKRCKIILKRIDDAYSYNL